MEAMCDEMLSKVRESQMTMNVIELVNHGNKCHCGLAVHSPVLEKVSTFNLQSMKMTYGDGEDDVSVYFAAGETACDQCAYDVICGNCASVVEDVLATFGPCHSWIDGGDELFDATTGIDVPFGRYVEYVEWMYRVCLMHFTRIRRALNIDVGLSDWKRVELYGFSCMLLEAMMVHRRFCIECRVVMLKNNGDDRSIYDGIVFTHSYAPRYAKALNRIRNKYIDVIAYDDDDLVVKYTTYLPYF